MKMPSLAFLLALTAATQISHAGTFAFKDDGPTSGVLTITEDDIPVLSYCYGDQLKAGVDPKYQRSCYAHPIYSLEGTPLTDDFPADHFHHRGLSWTWPYVETRSTQTQTWHPADPPLRQTFNRWIERTVSNDQGVTLTVDNHWILAGTDTVAREQVTFRIHPATNEHRQLDVAITLEAIGGPLTLRGTKEENKGYGGLAIRMAPTFKGSRLRTSQGIAPKDLVNTPLQWADLTGNTDGLTLIAGKHPHGTQPHWMARNSYAGFMNVSWPGLQPVILQPGAPITLPYRIIIHSTDLPPEKIQTLSTAE